MIGLNKEALKFIYPPQLVEHSKFEKTEHSEREDVLGSKCQWKSLTLYNNVFNTKKH